MLPSSSACTHLLRLVLVLLAVTFSAYAVHAESPHGSLWNLFRKHKLEQVGEKHDYPRFAHTADDHVPFPEHESANEITVAFFGDSGMNVHSERVFRMTRDHADAVVHVGDFSYEHGGAKAFGDLITKVYGKRFPYITTVGDHDLYEESTYRNFFVQMNAQVPGLECEGEWGHASVCRFRGIVFFGMGLMFHEADYEGFMEREMARHRDWPWKVCFWHRVATEFQPGHKRDTIGHYFYDLCREHGAIIITGHEHLYGRTHVLTSFQEPSADAMVVGKTADGTDLATIGEGQTFAVVAGLTGANTRNWSSKRMRDPWWASVAALQNAESFGSLLCTFRVGGHSHRAFCQFRDLLGVVQDQFEIRSLLAGGDGEISTSTSGPSTSFSAETCLEDTCDSSLVSPFAAEITSQQVANAENTFVRIPIHSPPAERQEKSRRWSSDKSRQRATRIPRSTSVKQGRMFSVFCGKFYSTYSRRVCKDVRKKYGVSNTRPGERIHSQHDFVAWPVEIFETTSLETSSSKKSVSALQRLLPFDRTCRQPIKRRSESFEIDIAPQVDLGEFYRDFERLQIRHVRLQITGSPLGSLWLRVPRWCRFLYWKLHWPKLEIEIRLAESTSKPILWKIPRRSVEQTGERAVWTSPELSHFVRKCWNRLRSPDRCVLHFKANVDGAWFLRNGFDPKVRIAPRIVVEYQRSDPVDVLEQNNLEILSSVDDGSMESVEEEFKEHFA